MRGFQMKLSFDSLPQYLFSSPRQFFEGEHHMERYFDESVLILMRAGELCFEEDGEPRRELPSAIPRVTIIFIFTANSGIWDFLFSALFQTKKSADTPRNSNFWGKELLKWSGQKTFIPSYPRYIAPKINLPPARSRSFLF